MRKGNPKKGLGPGLKRTPQRLAILDCLEGNTSHPSAEDIYRAVSKKYDSLSLATVYNTLNTLTQAGAVRELAIDPERKRYDPDTTLHHHLICVLCRKIVDVPEEIVIEAPKGTARDFTVLGSHVEFYGHCAACRKKR
jgi:Fur family peroxide stress response transcriptional regulator